MTYRARRRGILIFLAVFLTAAVIFVQREEYGQIQKNGEYMKNYVLCCTNLHRSRKYTVLRIRRNGSIICFSRPMQS